MTHKIALMISLKLEQCRVPSAKELLEYKFGVNMVAWKTKLDYVVGSLPLASPSSLLTSSTNAQYCFLLNFILVK